MALTNGTQLGPYEILSSIGSGGMGEVYKARDTRLHRIVAIKTLGRHVFDDSELKKRLEREAQAIAALNHPHICVLHDIGSQNGIEYLVMEYLEGETLASRLAKGPLPLDQMLDYAIQIGDALEKAHRASVTHRDLKPANIMLTKAGAKLLDFGLAKLREAGPAADGLSMLPTVAPGMTEPGTILGTLQYMAPEQLEGEQSDARSDIFSFGVVLYEMLTGKKAFDGKSRASMIAAILEHEPPPISSIQPMTPPLLDHLVRGCLAKDPVDRWQSVHDVVQHLKWIRGTATAPAGAAKVRTAPKLWIATAVFFTLTTAACFFYFFGLRTNREAEPMRFTVSMPEQVRLSSMAIETGVGASINTISPDGKHLIFSGVDTTTGKMQLYVRPIHSTEAVALPGTEAATYPFWSPGSDAVAFFAQRKLKRVSLSGGDPEVICNAPMPAGGTWSRKGVIVIGLTLEGGRVGLFRVSASDGSTTALANFPTEDDEFPQFLPDGIHFLYYASSDRTEDNAVYIGSLDSKDRKPLFKGATTTAAYAHPDHLLFVRDGALMIQPFDANRLALTGVPFRLVDHVSTNARASNGGYGLSAFSASDNGIITYRTNSRSLPDRFLWVDRDGKEIGPVLPPGFYRDPALSPNGQKLAFARRESSTGNFDISILDLASGKETRVTLDPADDLGPVWSPDGTSIMFASQRKTGPGLYRVSATGAGGEELVLPIKEAFGPYQWPSPDQFMYFDGDHHGDLSMVLLSKHQSTALGLRHNTEAADPALSPDGHWLGYVSRDSGRYEIYVTTYPSSSLQLPVTPGGGADTRWSKNGRELFYVSSVTGELMAVDVTPGNPPQFSTPRRIYAGALDYTTNHSFDLNQDETRFLVHVPDPGGDITVLLNWPSLLKN